MRTTLLLSRIVLRASILILLVLGILFWSGHALALVPLHMAFGLLLVLCLWTLAGLAASRGAPVGVAVAAAAWGLAVIAFGASHARLLPGAGHWVIQVLHLLVGLGTVGFAERIGRRVAARLNPAGG